MPAPTVPKPGESGSNEIARAALAQPAPIPADEVKEVEARNAALSALVARKRKAVRQAQDRRRAQQVADKAKATTDTCSGLRITHRCVRQEKWESSMRGKELIPFGHFSALRSTGKDQVVIGVLCSQPASARVSQTGERCAELMLTDLDPNAPRTVTLVLTGRAYEHWAHPEGAARRRCKVGAIMAVLNPLPVRRPAGGFTVAFEAQLLKLGMCPSLRLCEADDEDSLPCCMPYSAEGEATSCGTHADLPSRSSRKARRLKPMTPLRRQPRSAKRKAAKSEQSPAAAASSGELRRLYDALRQVSCRKRKCPAEPSRCAAANASEAAEQAVLRLAAAAAVADAEGSGGGSRLLLSELLELEVADFGPDEIVNTPLYEQVEALVEWPDDVVGVAARRLRRSWRMLLQSGAAASTRGGA